MGYITYSIHYGHGEVWSETRPFWDYTDMVRLASKEYLEAIAERYGAEYVYVVSTYVNGLEDTTLFENVEMRAV